MREKNDTVRQFEFFVLLLYSCMGSGGRGQRDPKGAQDFLYDQSQSWKWWSSDGSVGNVGQTVWWLRFRQQPEKTGISHYRSR